MSLLRRTLFLFSNHKTLISQQFVNKLHLSKLEAQQKQVEEVRIPVPWGHLAGKWWGPQNKRPILCLHGWQESCSSFDPLFNLLPEDVGLLAFDLPGNGYSSRLPKGIYCHRIDTSVLIRRIQKYFDWSKISLLGHSMGGITCFMYTALYPDDVDMLMVLDAVKPFTKEPGTAMNSTLENIDQFLQYDSLNDVDTKPPSYTYENLVNKIVLSTRKSVYPKNCKYVLERTIEKTEEDSDKFHFSRDNRLKMNPLIYMPHAVILEHTKRIKCPFVLIKATKSTFLEPKQYVDDVIDILKTNNKEFKYIEIEGTHHVHINEPEKVVGIVTNFLNKYNHVERKAGGIKDAIKISRVN